MTDHTYRGGASRVTSAPEGRTSFGPDGVRGRVVGGFGRLVDRLEANIHRAPADMQPAAQKAVERSALAGLTERERKALRKLLQRIERNLGAEAGSAEPEVED